MCANVPLINNLYLLKCYQPGAEGINIICYAGSGTVCVFYDCVWMRCTFVRELL